MVNLKIDDGNGHNFEVNGKAAFIVVFDPEGREGADAMSMLIGQSNTFDMAVTVGGCLGSMITEMEEDPVDQTMVALAAVTKLYGIIRGDGSDHDVVQKEVTPVKEDE